jgi:hypothetical protein
MNHSTASLVYLIEQRPTRGRPEPLPERGASGFLGGDVPGRSSLTRSVLAKQSSGRCAETFSRTQIGPQYQSFQVRHCPDAAERLTVAYRP